MHWTAGSMNGAAVPYGSRSTTSTRFFSERWLYISALCYSSMSDSQRRDVGSHTMHHLRLFVPCQGLVCYRKSCHLTTWFPSIRLHAQSLRMLPAHWSQHFFSLLLWPMRKDHWQGHIWIRKLSSGNRKQPINGWVLTWQGVFLSHNEWSAVQLQRVLLISRLCFVDTGASLSSLEL